MILKRMRTKAEEKVPLCLFWYFNWLLADGGDNWQVDALIFL